MSKILRGGLGIPPREPCGSQNPADAVSFGGQKLVTLIVGRIELCLIAAGARPSEPDQTGDIGQRG